MPKENIFIKILKIMYENTDILTIAITIGIAVTGWIIALLLQRRNIKDSHKVQIEYDVYKEFVEIRGKINSVSSKLGTIDAPFIAMETCMMPFKLKLKKQYKDTWIPYNEHECIMEGNNKWQKFIHETYDLYFELTDEVLQLLSITEDWAAVLKPFSLTKNILIKEINSKKTEIYNSLNKLRDYSIKNNYDWRNWNREEIGAITKEINDKVFDIQCYLEDFMILIHNKLLGSYFKHDRPIRKTTDPKYKVLYKNGLIENLDKQKIKQAKKWKKILDNDINKKLKNKYITAEEKNKLKSVKNNICPICQSEIFITRELGSKNSKSFIYACGHKYDII